MGGGLLLTPRRLVQVDAFACRPFEGNPAAVVPLETWPDDSWLQAVAAENNLSETAFTVPDASGAADFELRWFTPTCEVDLCGHATLAAGHVHLGDAPDRQEVRFATRQAGVLTVAREDGGYAMSLPAYPPAPREMTAMQQAMGGDPVAALHHPAGYALFVYAGAAEVLALKPDFAALAEMGDTLNIATAPAGTLERAAGAHFISRIFAPAAGVDEDPVTGSAHAVLAPYWAARLECDELRAFQASVRGGHLRCRVERDRVILIGQAVTVIEGRLFA